MRFVQGQALPLVALEAEALGEALYALKDARSDERHELLANGQNESQTAEFDAHTDACLNMLHDFGPQWTRRLNRLGVKPAPATRIGPPRRSPQVHPSRQTSHQPATGEMEDTEKTPRFGGDMPRVLHHDGEPSRAWKYGPDGRAAGQADKQSMRGDSPSGARDAPSI